MTSPRRRSSYLATAAAGLLLAAAACLIPGGSRQAATWTLASSSAPASSSPAACTGVTPQIIPAAGFIANPARAQGGHFWWRAPAGSGSVCVGTVIEWVQYTTMAAKTWKVIVYSAQHPAGQIAAEQTFTLPRGWYWWSFGIHRAYPGLRAVCLTATDAFGQPCVRFSSGSPVNALTPATSPAAGAGGPVAAAPGYLPASSPGAASASQPTHW